MSDRFQHEQDAQSHRDRNAYLAQLSAPDNARMADNKAKAQAGLVAALAEQKASGRDAAEALRTQTPVFPQICLREPDFLWDEATVAKFRQRQASELEAYYENILQCESSRLSGDDLKRLPAAIRFLDTRNKLAIQAGAEASARIATAQQNGQPANPLDIAAVQKAQQIESL